MQFWNSQGRCGDRLERLQRSVLPAATASQTHLAAPIAKPAPFVLEEGQHAVATGRPAHRLCCGREIARGLRPAGGQDDEVGQRFARALIDKQREGVQVAVLRDSAGTPPSQ